MQRLEQLWGEYYALRKKFSGEGYQLSDCEAIALEVASRGGYDDVETLYKASALPKPEDYPLPEQQRPTTEMPVRDRIQWYLDEIEKMLQKISSS